MSENFFDAVLLGRFCEKIEIQMMNRPYIMYTNSISIRIIALRSVNKIFTESYDFAELY
jgi:hypothetical protein